MHVPTFDVLPVIILSDALWIGSINPLHVALGSSITVHSLDALVR